MTATCDLCGAESLDLHTFERCGDCCLCRADLAGELLTIAEGLRGIAKYPASTFDPRPDKIRRHALALTQLAARLNRTAERTTP